MKRILKSFWGCIPIAFLLICVAIVAIIQSLTGDTLRIAPRNVLMCFGIVGFGILLVWGNIRCTNFVKKFDSIIYRVIEQVIKMLSMIVFLIAILASLFVMVLTYSSEHIVIRNDMKMVASVRSFLDEQVDYYQYKNPLFYGKWLGHENYGNGGGDPLTKAEIKKLDIDVINNREDELVFSISIDDYIESYNGYYWNDHNARYLSPSDEWRTQIYDTAIHSNHETIYYYFTENEKMWSLPTISVYAPTDKDYIQEITVNFDWHSYTENTYELYKQMCFYTLKVVFPELTDEQIIALYSEANDLGYKNVFSSDEWYSKDSVPYALFHKDGIGVYPYFAIGSWQNLCIIPVTEDTTNEFEQKGVKIYEIE